MASASATVAQALLTDSGPFSVSAFSLRGTGHHIDRSSCKSQWARLVSVTIFALSADAEQGVLDVLNANNSHKNDTSALTTA